MKSKYTIKTTNFILIERNKDYEEDFVYIDENRMIIGPKITIHLEYGTNKGMKRKWKTFLLSTKYTHTIGISFIKEDIYLHLHKYIPFKDNKFQFDYVEEEKIKLIGEGKDKIFNL